MNDKRTLVIGSTGKVGRQVVKQLAEKGESVVAATRNAAFYKTSSSQVEAVEFDYTKKETFENALKGVSKVFLVAIPLDPKAHEKLNPFIDVAAKTGLEHIVFVSALGVDYNEQSSLRKVEQHIFRSGIPYTIIRPNFFMDNFTTGFIAPTIASLDGIYVSAADSRTNFIATSDIGKAAVETLINSENHRNKEYNISGREALTHHEVAEIISETSGRDIKYYPISEEDLKKSAVEAGVPQDDADQLVSLYQYTREGHFSHLESDFESITGTKPLTFTEFAKKNSNHWVKEKENILAD